MAERRMMDRPAELARIRISAPVVDVTGRLVGWVKYVKLGTPDAAPITEPPSADDDLDTAFARALTQADPKVDATVADELIRNGFLKVASFGPTDNDLYVLANQIAAADEDTVRLSASIEDLLAERETPL